MISVIYLCLENFQRPKNILLTGYAIVIGSKVMINKIVCSQLCQTLHFYRNANKVIIIHRVIYIEITRF